MIFAVKILIVAFYSICIVYTNYNIYNHIADWLLKARMNDKLCILLMVLVIIGLTIVSYGSPFLLIAMMFGEA